jgi:hypothetical protein
MAMKGWALVRDAEVEGEEAKGTPPARKGKD